MDLLSRYKRHDDLIQQGAILELGEGASAHIARMHDSNPQYKKVTEQLARQRQYELDNLKGQKKNTAYAEIAEEAFAQVCTAIDDLHKKASSVKGDLASAATSSFWHSLVGIDKNGKPTTKVFGSSTLLTRRKV